MSDDDWKSKVGIVINFSPSDYDSVNYGDLATDERDGTVSSLTSNDSYDAVTVCGNSISPEESLFEDYGCTPPRTRISRKQKERKQREKESETIQTPKRTQAYKNCDSLNSMYLSDLSNTETFVDTSQSDDELVHTDTMRRCKRSLKLLRGSERDLKVNLSSVNVEPSPQTPHDEGDDGRIYSMPVNHQQSVKVETCNYFRSLTSKPVNFRKQKQKKHFGCHSTVNCPQDRVDFYNTFSLLIRMGSADKSADKTSGRQLSHEEDVWQNELKDLIWLELQAWHADRSLQEQDEYLCRERSKVGQLLKEIMEYRFIRRQSNGGIGSSSQLSDSGVGTDDASDNMNEDCGAKKDACEGCCSLFCSYCIETQNIAFREVENLMQRLDKAEQLYSSRKAFGFHYPLYASPEFVSRYKAMCIWYNMMRHQKLRLQIIVRMLNLDNIGKPITWSHTEDAVASTDSSDERYLDTHSVSRSTSVEAVQRPQKQQKVRFDVDGDTDSSSPSDSNCSTSSLPQEQPSDENAFPYQKLQHSLFPDSPDKKYMVSYRRYLEHVLKTRGLKKVLQFFEFMHKTVLRQVMFSLESHQVSAATDEYTDDLDECELDEVEKSDLTRYGYWSKESQAMNLPSYCSVYLYLVRVPVELTHQYLLMRLEQKPDHPSPLSISQLVREFREGVTNAAYLKQRYKKLVSVVLGKIDDSSRHAYLESIKEFEKSIRCMLEVHLDYFRDCLQMAAPALSQKKNLLEVEWTWLKEVSPLISGEGLVSLKVSHITIGLFKGIAQHLEQSIKTIMDNVNNEKFWEVEDASPKHIMLGVCRQFQTLFNDTREKALKVVMFGKSLKKDLGVHAFAKAVEHFTSCSKVSESEKPMCGEMIIEAVMELKMEILNFGDKITKAINDAEKTCDVTDVEDLDDNEKCALLSRCREVLHSGYKFGFEYYKSVCRMFAGINPLHKKWAFGMISFAHQWMRFVMERCERGRGLRPTWANHGLEFLTVVCEPDCTSFLCDKAFENLKSSIDECISHVVGSAVPALHPQSTMPRSRASSPSPGPRKSYLPSRSLQDCSGGGGAGTTPQRSMSLHTPRTSDCHLSNGFVDDQLSCSTESLSMCMTTAERVRLAVEELEEQLDNKLRSQNLLGTVKSVGTSEEIHIRPRNVNFTWQRGMKIGQGRFGKVYTAVNNKTGELMALKEVQLQPNDHRGVRHVAEELRIFESIQHNNIVRYYGVEIHREEMLIFMEYCAQGTLESLVAATESGLPEVLVRRYTMQLLMAVTALHNTGVVHRDIKTANIFLTDEGNSLKLGDFGCAAKIKAHTTMCGELQGFIGTQAYMAPEMFMKTNTDGHGRASDIWSVGCVVVEMASGKRPWAEYDSNFQIMFRVGMGQTPAIPDSLSKEGHHFLGQCFQHDPKERAYAVELLQHPFVRVDGDDTDFNSVFEWYSKLRIITEVDEYVNGRIIEIQMFPQLVHITENVHVRSKPVDWSVYREALHVAGILDRRPAGHVCSRKVKTSPHLLQSHRKKIQTVVAEMPVNATDCCINMIHLQH